METAKIVIGANFGDEGKGLMTDYFAHEAKERGKSCLVICHNGGSQRGHTVVSPLGLRHVFHHFGSGCFEGADTYLSSNFIVNPIIFNKELSELKRKELVTKCFVNKDCYFTTPFDMMINQITEEYRGENKHGSCGLGIYETINRAVSVFGCTVYKFAIMTIWERISFLNDICTMYLPHRLKELGIENIPTKWIEILSKKEIIIENFIRDFEEMFENIQFTNDGIINDYDCVIFEGGQGLLLDQNNTAYMPHLTPSNTGIKNPLKIIGERKEDIEACYVSRAYMTRHGKGRFDTECNKSEINEKMVDLTNIPNPYQDSLRYGKLELNDLRRRIDADLGNADVKKTLAITHMNEYKINHKDLIEMFYNFNIYVSDGMTHNDIKKYRRILP